MSEQSVLRQMFPEKAFMSFRCQQTINVGQRIGFVEAVSGHKSGTTTYAVLSATAACPVTISTAPSVDGSFLVLGSEPATTSSFRYFAMPAGQLEAFSDVTEMKIIDLIHELLRSLPQDEL